MKTLSINDEAIEQILSRQPNFVWSGKEQTHLDELRQIFCETHNKERISNLTKEDYLPGLGIKGGNMSYDLEWGTRDLGSIKGGSKYKFGYEADFPKIKDLIQRVVNVDALTAYGEGGLLSEELETLIKLSKEINGFKTGRTVVPKLLSIYFPTIFIPLFNDQDFLLSKLLSSGIDSENTGLKLYLENNHKFLIIKQKLEQILGRNIDNYEFARLLYDAFPKESGSTEDASNTLVKTEEPIFEALEVQHYQTLLHRNFQRLFPLLRYFDEEGQVPKNGQYDTQTVGIMDILAVGSNNDFVVIEIKRQATDKTIGQILRYMGWVKEELCKDGQKVTGIIVAERKDIQLEFALKIIPDVKFMKLGLHITLG
jgi:hypothetical protein